MSDELKARIIKLREVTGTACSDGNWDFSPYMLGMANGLLLGLATMDGGSPEYLCPPETWITDKKLHKLAEQVAEQHDERKNEDIETWADRLSNCASRLSD
jgi:hypothetical protein